jgi:hypothetical protein
MKDKITTTDLSRFGWRERRMAEELLRASREQGFPDDFEDDETTIMFNTHSGNVFFTNENFQIATMNGDKLESFYSCPYCGYEGFREDIIQHGGGNIECTRYLKEMEVIEDSEEEGGEINE